MVGKSAFCSRKSAETNYLYAEYNWDKITLKPTLDECLGSHSLLLCPILIFIFLVCSSSNVDHTFFLFAVGLYVCACWFAAAKTRRVEKCHSKCQWKSIGGNSRTHKAFCLSIRIFGWWIKYDRRDGRRIIMKSCSLLLLPNRKLIAKKWVRFFVGECFPSQIWFGSLVTS